MKDIQQTVVEYFWGDNERRLRQFLRKTNTKSVNIEYDSCSSDEDGYNNQKNIQAMQGLAYPMFPIDQIFQAKNAGYEIFKILSQTKLDKLGNNLDKQQSTAFTRDRIRTINARFEQIQKIAKEKQTDPPPYADSDLSSELNFSDSLEQKANYIYVEHLQLQHELRRRSKKTQLTHSPKGSHGEQQGQSRRRIQPVYPFRYGEKQAKPVRQRGGPARGACCAEGIPVGKQRGEDSGDEELSNHNLYMLNNGLHLDLDAKQDVEVDWGPANNVAARSRKAKDAQALQRYYDEVKAHVRNSKKGRSVFRFLRKKCLHEEDIDNILTLDVKHMEANQYQKDVIIYSRLNYQAVSITLSKKLHTKYVNPFLHRPEAKIKLF